ncbi:hypothetical protein B0T25DRAFT_466917 [Lasiosphaeria hispida]|uniref:Uncharacterized protein n=1 Tax=Lasiosphaeria hispida TaxID=260671 RepID=A0AAJ0H5A5_9PEZI|nr:hypothetical protein B0T25DRAFT_466917 [Lasiosphaeria hispida]
MCIYWHPPEHQLARPAAVTFGLERLEELDLATLVADRDVYIQDRGDLASFNKLSDDEIIVPGSPPFFSPITRRTEILLDAVNYDLQPRFPRYIYAFEPLLRAIEASSPGFNLFEATEMVSNASNLRKLFHIFQNRRRMVERYDLEWRRGVLFLSKWTDDPSLNSSMGHGAGFEKATCRYAESDSPLLHRSASHHRVVRYSFASLELIVQSEVDAHYCACNHTPAPAPLPTPKHPRRRSSTSPRTLKPPSLSSSPSIFAALALDDPGESPTFAASHPPTTTTLKPTVLKKLRIHRLGRDVPSHCLLEVKTHRAGMQTRGFAPEAQLYFSRRALLYTAAHRAGVFVPEGVVVDKGRDLGVWEGESQAVLGRMGAFLGLLRRRAGEMAAEGRERLSLVCESDGLGGPGVKAVLYVGQGGRLVPGDI